MGPTEVSSEPKTGNCLVCGDQLTTSSPRCCLCDTPYHDECFAWAGECSVYGCGSRIAAVEDAAPRAAVVERAVGSSEFGDRRSGAAIRPRDPGENDRSPWEVAWVQTSSSDSFTLEVTGWIQLLMQGVIGALALAMIGWIASVVGEHSHTQNAKLILLVGIILVPGWALVTRFSMVTTGYQLDLTSGQFWRFGQIGSIIWRKAECRSDELMACRIQGRSGNKALDTESGYVATTSTIWWANIGVPARRWIRVSDFVADPDGFGPPDSLTRKVGSLTDYLKREQPLLHGRRHRSSRQVCEVP